MASVMAFASSGLIVGAARMAAFAASDRGHLARPVVFVSYVDVEGDIRGRSDFDTLRKAVQAIDPDLAADTPFQFVELCVAHHESIDALMRRVAAMHPAAIIATSDDVIAAARASAGAVPVIFASHADPVAAGYVKSVGVPGAPRTGFTYHVRLTAKMLELLTTAYAGTHHVGIVSDPFRAAAPDFADDVQAARRALGVRVTVFTATTAGEVERALRDGKAHGVDAWYVPVGEALWNDEDAVLAAVERTGAPVLYERTRLAQKAGAMAYEPRVLDPFAILASQLVLVLRGADPTSIPIERPSQFELSVHLGASGRHTVSKDFVKRADRVIRADAAAQ